MKRTQFQNPTYLTEKQYNDAKNLNARYDLHQHFTIAEKAWLPWVFERLELQAGEKVLECGCGPGHLWRQNLAQIPQNCRIFLTDLSKGMVTEARKALAGSQPAFTFQRLNIEQLPFVDDSFDLIVANHMLYHVPDIPQAISEVKRVLRPDGRFVAATNGRHHMKELYDLGKIFLPDSAPLEHRHHFNFEKPELSFRLENGAEFLNPHFPRVDRHLYPSALQVTKSAPLVAYILSLIDIDYFPAEGNLKKLSAHLEKIINRENAIRITKESGLFIAYVLA